ncbi:unnamed protein product, partial [Discosporangium mesarthrocarpum]
MMKTPSRSLSFSFSSWRRPPMARLANDCFASSSDMISAAEALEKISAAAAPVVTTENISLFEAGGRIVAENIIAPRNVPPSDNSAVDGYAFRFSDYEKDPNRPYGISGQSKAGHPWTGTSMPNTVVKILTGAIMPEGFDTIAMVEDISVRDNQVILPTGLKAGANCRKMGEDIRE